MMKKVCQNCGMPITKSCFLNRKESFICGSYLDEFDVFYKSKACIYTSELEKAYLEELQIFGTKETKRDTMTVIRFATERATMSIEDIEGTHFA